MRDRYLILSAAFLRALATGLVAVLLGLHLSARGLDASQIALVVGAGLAGTSLAALLVTFAGDRLGRRGLLVGLGVLTALGGAGLALGDSLLSILLAATLGMVNGMGRDRGPSLILDQAILPGTGGDQERTRIFAWYNVAQDAGHALGGLAAGAPTLLRRFAGLAEPGAFRLVLLGYSGLLLLAGLLYLPLSGAAEAADRGRRRVPLAPRSRRILARISALFAMDSVGGGFLATTLLAYFFYERFGVGAGTLGLLFMAARLANAGSHLAASWLARRIGLVNTMVFTHLPSSLLLMTVPLAPSFWVAALLFLLRESLVEMDVPTRQSYVMAMVRPEERTVASGVTHLVRLAAWAVAPTLAGLLMKGASLAMPLVVGASLKIAYDVILYISFRRLKPPEEGGG